MEVRALDVAGPALRVQRPPPHRDHPVPGRGGRRSSLEGSTVDPGNVIVEGDDVTIRGQPHHRGRPTATPSTSAPPTAAGPAGVRGPRQRARPGHAEPGSTAHVDCLQVMSAEQLVVSRQRALRLPRPDAPREERPRARRRRADRPQRPARLPPAHRRVPRVHDPAGRPRRAPDVATSSVDGNSVAGAFRAVAAVPGLALRGNAIDAGGGRLRAPRSSATSSAAPAASVPPGNLVAAPALDRRRRRAARPATRRAGSPTVDAGPPTMDADADGRDQRLRVSVGCRRLRALRR